MEDLQRAVEVLAAKSTNYKSLFDYAEGNQPLKYSTERLREVFERYDTKFIQNWCGVVLNSTLERLILKGFDFEDKTINEKIDQFWSKNSLNLDAQDVHKASLITSESYLIVWEGPEGLEVYYNDPRMVHVFYLSDRPKIKDFAAKWYKDDRDEKWHLILYYPDHLEYYVTKSKNKVPSKYSEFTKEIVDSEPNKFGIIPVFHFRTPTEFNQILYLQDAVNKLFSDMMVAAEFGAFPQRWIISNADTEDLKNGAGVIWTVPPGDGDSQNTALGQFSAVELKNYLDAIDNLASSIAVITRTPKHYFLHMGSNVSGDALLSMESPLVRKCEQIQERLSIVWVEFIEFIAQTMGIDTEVNIPVPVWSVLHTTQPLASAQTIKTEVSADIPLITAARRAGWDKQEIDQMVKDKQEEDKKKMTLAKAFLHTNQTQEDQSNDWPEVA